MTSFDNNRTAAPRRAGGTPAVASTVVHHHAFGAPPWVMDDPSILADDLRELLAREWGVTGDYAEHVVHPYRYQHRPGVSCDPTPKGCDAAYWRCLHDDTDVAVTLVYVVIGGKSYRAAPHATTEAG